MLSYKTAVQPSKGRPCSTSHHRPARQAASACHKPAALAQHRLSLPFGMRPLTCKAAFSGKQLLLRVSRDRPRPQRQSLQCAAEVHVRFKLKQQVNFGESHKLVGGHPSLGNWDVGTAPHMQWNDGDVWMLEVDLPEGQDLEFKIVRVGDNGADWEDGNNRTFKVPNGGSTSIDVDMRWARTESSKQQVAASNGNKSQKEQYHRVPSAAHSEVLSSLDSDRLDHNNWQGQQTKFMRANEWSRDRDGRWDTSGLDGAARFLVQSDEKSPNWLKKLEVVKELLVDRFDDKKPDLDALANAYIYLQWISTGAIPCVEGGGHFRPNRHAELSQVMFRSLEWVIGDESNPAKKQAAFVARKIHPKLPSFTDEFRASTPLTRIRDIAHRNDIPHELKQEIKHTLQNKLHRNAGPEDLIATETMLKRLVQDKASRGYSDAFINEFITFTAELRDFFNAGNLQDMLNTVKGSLDEGGVQVVDTFLESKGRLDNTPAHQVSQGLVMEVLHNVTTVRALLATGLSSGLRNDAPDAALVMRQRWRLAELKCEDYSFVLLSRFINMMEAKGGVDGLACSNDVEWSLPLGAAVLGVRHMGLGGWEPAECMAVEHELMAWQRQGHFTEQENALRLKATLERAQLLTQGFTDWLLNLFTERANLMGHALGIQHERVSVFTEAEIRASIVFQLSKLVDMVLKATRKASGGAEWDTIVAGTAVGRLECRDYIDPADIPTAERGDIILLVKSATGDEEVAAVGQHLRGVILCQQLPHLSHLGVRARQDKVVFVTCDDADIINDKVRPLIGQTVEVVANGESVTVGPATTSSLSSSQTARNGSAPATNGTTVAASGKVDKVSRQVVLPLHSADSGTGGAKSACCAELAKLEASASSFKTPQGAVLPFGVMDCAIQAAGLESEFQSLLDSVEHAAMADLDRLCDELQQLVASLKPEPAVLKQIGDVFDCCEFIIVRSSSNVEDLAGMSGAGLYESIPNVDPADHTALGAAIAEVWASLYTRRAVLSRRAAGVPQSDASMAILLMQMLSPDLSFVLHTVSPLEHDPAVLYAEVAVGMGETLASGTRGSAWRLSVNKQSGKVTTHAFANFSRAYLSDTSSSDGTGGIATATAPQKLKPKVVDYSSQALSRDSAVREAIGRQLATVGSLLEEQFNGPQDVEGCFVGQELYIVQTRPQP